MATWNCSAEDFEETIAGYFESLPQHINDDLYRQVLRDVRRQFEIPKVHPLHINDCMRHFPHPEKSPGEPYASKGLKCKYEVDPNRIKQYVRNLKYEIYKKCTTPCTPAACTVTSTKDKFRMIWGYPAHMTYAEGMFALPLIHGFKRNQNSPYGLWIQYSKRHLQALRARRLYKRSLWLGLNWKRFDQRVPAWLIRDVFVMLWSYIDTSQYTDWGTPEHHHLLPRLMNRIILYFIETPIKLPTGKVFRKRWGVPTGSYFTNMVETLSNAVVTQYCLRRLDARYSLASQWYMGDDSLVLLHQNFNHEQFASLAKEKFGFELDTEKTKLGHNVSFLGYKMSPAGRPIADYDKLLAQLLVPSNPDKSESDFVTRVVALQLSRLGFGRIKSTNQDLVVTRADLCKFVRRERLYLKLELLGLSDFPPLRDVMLRVC